MRKLTAHQSPGLNDFLMVEVGDDPGPGGASHIYNFYVKAHGSWQEKAKVRFQKGPVHETGPEGISDETLLAVVLDRLESFQKGDFPCKQNEQAAIKIKEALMWLHDRTKDRIARGVEGTSQQ